MLPPKPCLRQMLSSRHISHSIIRSHGQRPQISFGARTVLAFTARRQFSASTYRHIRLLNTKTIKLVEFSGTNIPPYAILSHTWGCEEVSFREMDEGRFDLTARGGNSKIRRCCEEAAKDGYSYAWIDSCCIDKRSSAELSEAINSMFKWYSNAAVCYAYLSDLGRYGDLDNAQWFSRGWTLQELIAPKQMRFFDQDWRFIGTRATLALQLENITGVSKEILADSRELSSNALAGTSISSKMSWASHRVTTREEDMAYCLMGLFNVNMPILYGEGLKAAFKRLQLEIIKVSPDQSIFAWRAKVPDSGLLAHSPKDFRSANRREIRQEVIDARWWATVVPYQMTNFGLSINLPLVPCPEEGRGAFYAVLGTRQSWYTRRRAYPIMIMLKEMVRTHYQNDSQSFYRRVRCNEVFMYSQNSYLAHYYRTATYGATRKNIYVLEDEVYNSFKASSGSVISDDDTQVLDYMADRT